MTESILPQVAALLSNSSAMKQVRLQPTDVIDGAQLQQAWLELSPTEQQLLTSTYGLDGQEPISVGAWAEEHDSTLSKAAYTRTDICNKLGYWIALGFYGLSFNECRKLRRLHVTSPQQLRQVIDRLLLPGGGLNKESFNRLEQWMASHGHESLAAAVVTMQARRRAGLVG